MILTLYSKPGCHLCAELRSLLDALQPEYGYTIQEVDITQSNALFQKYRYEIPVLIGEGVEVARGKVTEAELRSRFPISQ